MYMTDVKGQTFYIGLHYNQCKKSFKAPFKMVIGTINIKKFQIITKLPLCLLFIIVVHIIVVKTQL